MTVNSGTWVEARVTWSEAQVSNLPWSGYLQLSFQGVNDMDKPTLTIKTKVRRTAARGSADTVNSLDNNQSAAAPFGRLQGTYGAALITKGTLQILEGQIAPSAIKGLSSKLRASGMLGWPPPAQ